MTELFVWYRVDAAQVAAAQVAVLAMQRALEIAHPGLAARLLARDAGSDMPTWMETYACPGTPSGVDAALRQAIERHARSLDRLLEGPRHTEAFEVVRG